MFSGCLSVSSESLYPEGCEHDIMQVAQLWQRDRATHAPVRRF